MAYIIRVNSFLIENFGFNALDIVAVIISGLAMLFAILIPARIANNQNRIALYEKRFSAYSNLLKLKSFAEGINKSSCEFVELNDDKDIWDKLERDKSPAALVRLQFASVFKCDFMREDCTAKLSSAMALLTEIELSVHMLPMLYSKKIKKIEAPQNVSKEIEKIFTSLVPLISDVAVGGGVDDKNRVNYMDNIMTFFDKYADFFESQMMV